MRSQERSIAMTRATVPPPAVLVLTAQTAEELMVPNPISLRGDATLPEAVALMTDRGFSAAPVIDEAGRPIGVLSRTDVLVHEREQVRHALPADDVHAEGQQSWHEGFSIEIADSTCVRDIMTPTLFTVNVNTSAADMVKRMCDWKVHQLFVVDDDDSLVGVISALDIVRSLTEAT
jgi:CBS domain-containing protein